MSYFNIVLIILPLSTLSTHPTTVHFHRYYGTMQFLASDDAPNPRLFERLVLHNDYHLCRSLNFYVSPTLPDRDHLANLIRSHGGYVARFPSADLTTTTTINIGRPTDSSSPMPMVSPDYIHQCIGRRAVLPFHDFVVSVPKLVPEQQQSRPTFLQLRAQRREKDRQAPQPQPEIEEEVMMVKGRRGSEGRGRALNKWREEEVINIHEKGSNGRMKVSACEEGERGKKADYPPMKRAIEKRERVRKGKRARESEENEDVPEQVMKRRRRGVAEGKQRAIEWVRKLSVECDVSQVEALTALRAAQGSWRAAVRALRK